MNKQRTVLLIVVVALILLFQVGRAVFKFRVNRQIETSWSSVNEAVEPCAPNVPNIPTLDENGLVRVNVLGLKNTTPYPIVFHYNSLANRCRSHHLNQVFNADSSKVFLADFLDFISNPLDSLNTIHVSIFSDNFSTSGLSLFFYHRKRLTQNVRFHYSHPIVDAQGNLTVKVDTSSVNKTWEIVNYGSSTGDLKVNKNRRSVQEMILNEICKKLKK